MDPVLNIGDQAQLVQPIIQGEILDIRYNKGAAQLEMLLTYQDAGGETQTRWFLQTQLKVAQ